MCTHQAHGGGPESWLCEPPSGCWRTLSSSRGWVVEDLFPCGLTLIAGDPKIGKSWFGLDLALCVASGRAVLGASQQRRALSSISDLKIPSIASRDACRDCGRGQRQPMLRRLCTAHRKRPDGAARRASLTGIPT